MEGTGRMESIRTFLEEERKAIRLMDLVDDVLLLNPAMASGNDVNGDARALRRGGKINDEGELESEDYMADKQALRNVSLFSSWRCLLL